MNSIQIICFGIVTTLLIIILLMCTVILSRLKKQNNTEILRMLEHLRNDMHTQHTQLRQELSVLMQTTVRNMGEMLASSQTAAANLQLQKQEALQAALTSQMLQMEKRIQSFSLENENKLEAIRTTVEKRLAYIQQDNNNKLEQMRQTVDEKLQKTLDDKMNQSFKMISERLEQVYKGLGEMQTLAVGVGDLKKVLSNVKSRGILGEIQLGAILTEILAPEQYDANVCTKPNSRSFVEFAVKLPNEDGSFIWLPIDSKFPSDAYTQLLDAYDSGSPEAVQAAAAALQGRLKSFAKDIHDKYIAPPYTTEFAIMFLPFEGLYAEAVNRGMVEVLQREYHINIVGPSTMAALLNSLQMGFKTFAIHQRSGEVWDLLGAVKTEFDKFSDVLKLTQQRLEQANSELDKLVGVRTRQIQRKLKNITRLSEQQTANLLPACDTDCFDDDEAVNEIF